MTQSLSGKVIEITPSAPVGLYRLFRDKESALFGEHLNEAYMNDAQDSWVKVFFPKTFDGTTNNGISRFYTLDERLSYLAEGDIIQISSTRNSVRVLWRASSKHNFLFMTERCNQLCLMCSQPPRDLPDSEYLVTARLIVKNVEKSTKQIGITGGEPLLHGDQFIEFLSDALETLEECQFHVLTNGRKFSDSTFSLRWSKATRGRVTTAIPLYSHSPHLHDYIVQDSGAFDQAVKGILNLAANQNPIEIRFVIQKANAPHLLAFAEWVCRNIPFVNQVSLMGLEMTGLALVNKDDVWIEPQSYASQLQEAVSFMEAAGLNVKVYNLPLCLIPEPIRHSAVKSISDWKNSYLEVCSGCDLRSQCTGFFSTSKGHLPSGVQPIQFEKGSK